ncbi:MAG: RNA 2',3'-cyclic phosphodiesterase, partial [Deltaproteobacteria bacterium]|nr:RNA 2',3'-cyclic phosphodiesterase [Deltaproteobacteria bacterium]
MEQIRVFIALNLPVGVFGEVQGVQKALRTLARRHDEALSWVPASNMHITLKFLGDLPRARAFAIRDRLAPALEGREGFALSLREVGVFPDEARPRVLWLGVGDERGHLAQLVATIESCLDDLGFPKETRPYHAHVTLGRFKRGSTPPPFWQDIKAPPHPARGCEVVLYQSELSQAGAEYTALARFALSSALVEEAVAPEE